MGEVSCKCRAAAQKSKERTRSVRAARRQRGPPRPVRPGAGAPRGARSERSRDGPGDGQTRRLGQPGEFPLRPGDPRLDQTSSSLLPRASAGEEDPGGRCWGRGKLPAPAPNPSRLGRLPSAHPAPSQEDRLALLCLYCYPLLRSAFPWCARTLLHFPLLFLLRGRLPPPPPPLSATVK